MNILVCGGRHFMDATVIANYLDSFLNQSPFIIEGGAKGADFQAKKWAERRGVHFAEIPALWSYYNRSAGMLRNKAMLNLKPDICVAFPGGRGTTNMMNLCRENNIPVIEVKI